ncbi:hypothetical protein Htur_4588 (plasmid) [Haloterrigena turkmenica DSM 5511]|uniref:Uncharacterized protein n=1 Tax=Haloterrigena turkmenica (strain ATCC 51198 / DSM 5511 / JCM 9101 / NCIMB 13204 / VKM B-1734 / 4k) TaxID=543526 RepID=D2S1Y1_HALTV|nr:hypothetical protein Htur_4588 [Haloterrigena turkmenica DSM 5511]
MTATVVIVLFVVSNADRYIQKIETVTTRICDCLNEIAPPRSAVLCNHAVQIVFRVRSKIPECFEYVSTMTSRITRRRIDVVFVAIDRECVYQLWSGLIEGINDTDSDELALVFRVTGIKRLKI